MGRKHKHTWHRMTRMTRPDCAVMCNLINTHTHTRRDDPRPNQCNRTLSCIQVHRMFRLWFGVPASINVSVHYIVGFLPDMILLTLCYYHRGTRLNAMSFCLRSICFHLIFFLTILLPFWEGCSEGLQVDAFRLSHHILLSARMYEYLLQPCDYCSSLNTAHRVRQYSVPTCVLKSCP